MIGVTVTIRSKDAMIPAQDVEGFVPAPADCPLAVTRRHTWRRARWHADDEDGWCIVHRSSGLALGEVTWDTRELAMAALLHCDPSFPAWPQCGADHEAPANVACKAMFRAACEAVANG